MAEASVKIFLQRLDSLLLHEANTFSGLEGEMEWTRNSLREIGGIFGDIGTTEGDAAVHNWVNKLRDVISDMDDRIDEFIIQMNKQHGSERTALAYCFTNELQKMNSCLTETVQQIKELNDSMIIEGEKEDNKENSHGIEGLVTEFNASVTIKGEKEDSNENPHGIEGQSTELHSATIKGEKKDNKEDSHGIEGLVTEFNASLTIKGEKEDSNENPHGIESQPIELDDSATIKGEKEDNKEDSHGIEGLVTEFNVSLTIKGEKEDSNESPHGIEGQSTELDDSATIKGEKEDNKVHSHGMEGQTSASSDSFAFKLNYTNLPYYLKYCLMYCCIFPETYWIPKGRLIRLLVAEGLIQEKAGKITEDVAEENINELVSQGMLQVKDKRPGNGTKLSVPSPYREFSLHDMEEENFIASCTSSDSSIPYAARRVSVNSDTMKTAPNLNNLRPRSLFLFGNKGLSEEIGNWLNFYGVEFLRVLDLEDAKIKTLPDEVGDLIHLTYLGLKNTDINKLPERLGDLRALQTLDIRWCGNIGALPNEVINLARLRHLKMFKNMGVCGVKLPAGIGRLNNLLTLTGIHAGGGIAGELGSLIQLRRLGVMDVAEDNISEVSASIMKMQGLLCLSLEAKHTFNEGNLVLLESFSPPPLLRKLRLEGILVKVPNWLGLMERLTNLRLGFSHLSENPTLVLQHLPNLKILTLWHAHDAKQLGKEFCRAGGFPKLESLSIASRVLEEWTELEEGALPSLKYLHLHNCLRLRMLPEGLQLVTTLKQLDLLPLLNDHAERLKPDGGEENYKIENIPQVSFFPMSMLVRRS